MADTPADHGTRIEFFGGVGVIGGSKMCISTGRARVVFDCGADLPPAADLFRAPVVPRPGRELHDLVAVGQTHWIPGLFDPDQRPPSIAPDRHDDRELSLFVSHAHVDHDGLLGHVREGLEVHAHPETVRLHGALALAGRGPSDRLIRWRSITEPVQVGDLRVELIRVDHDVPGACAILVHSPDGLIAYTGDLNFHRDGGARSQDFVERARGAAVLLSETTTLSNDQEPEIDSEDEILGRWVEALHRPGLQLVSLYERDLERIQRWVTAAQEQGRTIIWPGTTATVLAAAGLADVTTWDTTRPQAMAHHAAVANAVRAGLTSHPPQSRPPSLSSGSVHLVSLAEVVAAPQRFVVQPDADDPAALLDLPVGSDTVWVHSQGEPLGPFMANWGPFVDWLAQLGIETVVASSSGHAHGRDLREMVRQIDPAVLFPIHGFRPERLVGPRTTVLPEYGVQYRLDGSPV